MLGANVFQIVANAEIGDYAQMLSNVLVVVRSAHERTEELAAYLACKQASEQHVVIIHERPFSKALAKSFKIGLDYGLDWTLCLDADCLLLPTAIAALIDAAEKQSCDFFGLQGAVVDKFHLFRRHGGYHLYRTTHLSKAAEYITSSDISLRPETYVKEIMKSHGYPWFQLADVFAVHDFEQYYRDIYRTMVVRTRKSPEKLHRLIDVAIKYSKHDVDFLIALWGLRVGMQRKDKVLLDAVQYVDEIEALLLAHGIEEKPPLPSEPNAQLPLKILKEVNKRHRYERFIRLAERVHRRAKYYLQKRKHIAG